MPLIGSLQTPKDPLQAAETTAEATTPSTISVVKNGFLGGLAGADIGITNFTNKYLGLPTAGASSPSQQTYQSEKDLMSQISMEQNNLGESWTQEGLGFVANMIGSSVHPAALLVGSGAAKVAELGYGIGAPIVGKLASLFGIGGDETASNIVGALTTAGAGVAGNQLPTALYDNYDDKTKQFDWNNIAKDSLSNFGYGVAFDGVFMAAGILKGMYGASKIVQEAQRSAADIKSQNAAKAEKIDTTNMSPDEAAFQKEYVANGKTAKAQELAVPVLKKAGIDVDEKDGSAIVPLLSTPDIDNFNSALAHESGNNLDGPLKNAMTDFISNKNMDAITGNKPLIDGLKEFSSIEKNNIDAEREDVGLHQKKFEESTIDENSSLSQKNLLNKVRNGETKYHIPKEVKSQLAKGEDGMPLLHPEEELNQINERLSSDKLNGKSLDTLDYNRLKEMADAHGGLKARHLLERVNKDIELNHRAAYVNIAEHITAQAEAGYSHTADVGNVLDYLSKTIADKQSKLADLPESDFNESTPQDLDTSAESIQSRIDNINEESPEDNQEMTKDAQDALDKAVEFKNNRSALDDFIKCMTGGE